MRRGLPAQAGNAPSLQKMDNKNAKLDELLQRRQDAINEYARATEEMIGMGVLIKERYGIVKLPANYIWKKYDRSGLEFEWEVEYKDGEILRQFQIEGEEGKEGLPAQAGRDRKEGKYIEHNFSDIDEARIKRVSCISNFHFPTDNIEKRVIVSLDFESGIFSFLNGHVSQEVKAAVSVKEVFGPKKLVLFARKRVSVSLDGEEYYYNRFVIGFEAELFSRKIIIMPNGAAELFE